jgi:hypothetical protein
MPSAAMVLFLSEVLRCVLRRALSRIPCEALVTARTSVQVSMLMLALVRTLLSGAVDAAMSEALI